MKEKVFFSQRVIDCDEFRRGQQELAKDLYGTDTIIDDIEGCDT